MLKILLFVFAGLVLFNLSIAFVAEARNATTPKTHLYYQQPGSFSGNKALSFEIRVQEPVGVTEVRLYFRFDSSQPFIYREMMDEGDGVFSTQLPVLKPTVQAIEYVFLVVNQHKQIIISKTYLLTKKIVSGTGSGAQYIESKPYLLKTEVAGTETVRKYFQQPEKISFLQKPSQLHYGILAGFFSPKQIGAEVVSGYFGAFRYDLEKGMVPVEGYIVVEQSSRLFITGENNRTTSDTATEEESIPIISGQNWAGVFWRSDDYAGTAVSLTAQITQNSNGVVTITTTLVGIGQYFQGNIYLNGHMLLYDAYDNEDWTTHYGPATDSYIMIADFVRRPTLEDPSPPLNIIELKRSVPLGPIFLLLK